MPYISYLINFPGMLHQNSTLWAHKLHQHPQLQWQQHFPRSCGRWNGEPPQLVHLTYFLFHNIEFLLWFAQCFLKQMNLPDRFDIYSAGLIFLQMVSNKMVQLALVLGYLHFLILFLISSSSLLLFCSLYFLLDKIFWSFLLSHCCPLGDFLALIITMAFIQHFKEGWSSFLPSQLFVF